MESSRSVALVGRPNVGKSRLFNRLARRRIAIVHDEPGVTRDVNAVEIDDDYILMDTGGIGLAAVESDSNLSDAVEEQINFAIQAAAVILLVVDGRQGLTPLDDVIIERLRKSGKSPVLVVNKIDVAELEPRVREFDELGIKESCSVSAEHGLGISDLRSIVDRHLGPRAEKESAPTSARTRLCLAGRTNVGKSSLCNRISRSERLVVSEVPGTTRDSVDLDLDMPGPNGCLWRFRITDTAGLKRSGKLKSSVEYFSSVRSARAIARADIVYLVVDAVTGITKQDKAIAGQIVEAGKAVAVVVNKWDLAIDAFRRNPLPGYENEIEFRDHFARAVRRELFFLPRSPILFVSALHDLGMDEILALARKLEERSSRDLPTAQVNKLVAGLFVRQKSRHIGGKQFKIYYAVQIGHRPFRVRLYCNTAGHLEDGYRRYLQAGFISEFSLEGCPVKFQLVGKGPARAGVRQRKQRRTHGSG